MIAVAVDAGSHFDERFLSQCLWAVIFGQLFFESFPGFIVACLFDNLEAECALLVESVAHGPGRPHVLPLVPGRPVLALLFGALGLKFQVLHFADGIEVVLSLHSHLRFKLHRFLCKYSLLFLDFLIKS